MAKPRKQIVDLSETSYYHCIGRCVRRAFLCGDDQYTGKNFDHRKDWMLSRLSFLSRIFAIDVAAYAFMSNHYHLVLRIDQDTAKRWDEREVCRRWKRMFSQPLIVQKYLRGEGSDAERGKAREIINEWRRRLYDLSWFMKQFNEYIARLANAEDLCKGRFWESRFKSQALLGESAVLTCMAYVDLNPVRANMANTPEDSSFTSIQQRLQQVVERQQKSTQNNKQMTKSIAPIKLMPLVKQKTDNHPHAIGYTLKEYTSLIDWVSRAKRTDKKGAVDASAPKLIQRMGLNLDELVDYVLTFDDEHHYPVAHGPLDKIKSYTNTIKQKFIRGQNRIKLAYQ